MSAITIKHFSTVEYIQKLRQANFTEQQAETLAQEAERMLVNVLEQAQQNMQSKELATKGDIALVRGEIRESELRLQKEIAQVSLRVVSIMGAFGVFFIGILAKGFHWF